MAAHSNRSPSPLSSRPSNPNPRNSEIYSTTRRSFNGNNSPFAKPSPLTNPRRSDPIIPANSSSDFAPRGLVGTGSCLKDCEEKENIEKDHIPKTSKLQSPAAKGSKNFMAPTISAASKFTPSPRKKVLVERNDPVRTSISLSDGKAMFFSNVSEDLEPKPEMSCHQNQKNPEKKEVVHEEGHPVRKPCSKKVTFSNVPQDSQNADESFSSDDSLKMESSSKNNNNNNNISCSPVSPPIAPLDADPSMPPPYDPKTNYLSPRPQFLYYKPNPRIEVLLNKEKGMDDDEFKPLEDDSFMNEIMSDNFSSDSEREELEVIASEETLIGFEDDLHLYGDSEKEEWEAVASDDMVMGLEFLEDDLHEDHVSVDSEKEKLEAIASKDMVVGLDELDDDLLFDKKNGNKSWGWFSRLMCVSMVMMLLMACGSVFVTRSPLLEEFGLIKDLSFSDLGNLYHHQSRVAANAELNFHRLARRINQFSVYCVSFIFKVANELGKGETTLLGPLKYMNLSDLQKGSWHDGRHFLKNNEVSEDLEENVEDDDDELDEDLDTTEMKFFEQEEEEAYAEKDCSDVNFENEIDTQEDEVSEIEEKIATEDSSSDLDFEYSEDNTPQSPREIVTSILPADQLAAIISHDQENELELEVVPSEIVETEEKSDSETRLISYAPAADITLLDENNPSDVRSLSEEGVQSLKISEDKYLVHYNAVGISSLFAALLAFAAFIFQYKRNPNPSLANVVEEAANKQTDHGFSGIKQTYQEKAFSSQNWQREVNDDAIGGESSCPSEMSSFQKSASYTNNNKKEMRGGASEVQSIERKTRMYQHSKRESLASSSSEFTKGSPSYGSFTTFEKIPIKNANGEDEIITPVRRSSRIRNHHQITSP